MNSLAVNLRYQPREPSRRLKGVLIVIALHAALGYALVSGMARKGLNLIKKPLEAVIIQEVFLPPPPPPPVKLIKPPEPLAPRTDSAPPIPRADSVPVPHVSPVELAPSEAQVATKPTPPVVATPAPAAAPDHQKAQVASMENEYASMLRTLLNSIKRYPTGRAASQQRPQGKVKVWFTLARSGSLLEAGILESSNSNLLDDAALATVRRGVYPRFPANTWDGEDLHKFLAEIEFSPPSA